MKRVIFTSVFIKAVLGILSLSAAYGQTSENVNYKGQLKVGQNESEIVFSSEETGDLAVFCFKNKSYIGKKILSKCQNNKPCEFSGKVIWGNYCSIKGNFSARARIISLKGVKSLPKL